MVDLFTIFQAILLFLAIMDPFLGVIALLAISQKESKQGKIANANKAALVAGSVLLVFVISGSFLLNIFQISIPSFQIAGGIILLLMGAQTMLAIDLRKKNLADKEAAAIIIGTPIIAGPGTITAIILQSKQINPFFTAIAVGIALLITWLILRIGIEIGERVPRTVIRVFSGLMGLFLTAVAIELITSGIKSYIS